MNKKANTWSEVTKIIIALVILLLIIFILFQYFNNARTNIETCPGTCKSSCNFPSELQYASTCIEEDESGEIKTDRDKVCCVTPDQLRSKEETSDSGATGSILDDEESKDESGEEEEDQTSNEEVLGEYRISTSLNNVPMNIKNGTELKILDNEMPGFIQIAVEEPIFAQCKITIEKITGGVVVPEYTTVLSEFYGCDPNRDSRLELSYEGLRNTINAKLGRVTIDIYGPSREKLLSKTTFYLTS